MRGKPCHCRGIFLDPQGAIEPNPTTPTDRQPKAIPELSDGAMWPSPQRGGGGGPERTIG